MSGGPHGAFIKGAPADTDDEDLVPDSEDLPDDIADDDFGADEEPEAQPLPADDLDAPAEGTPHVGEIPVA